MSVHGDRVEHALPSLAGCDIATVNQNVPIGMECHPPTLQISGVRVDVPVG
ncbi:MAG: hypothetical protein R3C56_21380 [Pirellulaceae bacterium]